MGILDDLRNTLGALGRVLGGGGSIVDNAKEFLAEKAPGDAGNARCGRPGPIGMRCALAPHGDDVACMYDLQAEVREVP